MNCHLLQSGEVISHDIADYPDGIVVAVDKPYRWTSADVVRKVKWAACRHFGKKNLKVGHAGTLDPLATGLLLVCIGPATRLAQTLQDHDKEYIAGVTFGATTASYDLEKEVVASGRISRSSEPPAEDGTEPLVGDVGRPGAAGVGTVPEQPVATAGAPLAPGRPSKPSLRDPSQPCGWAPPTYDAVGGNGFRGASRSPGEPSPAAIAEALTGFVGEQEQVAPLFSAKSVDGVRAYEMARRLHKAGQDVGDSGILRANRIRIDKMELLGCGRLRDYIREDMVSDDRIHVASLDGWEDLPACEILVACSKGTYIRALARDLGEALGTEAFLHSLRRTRIGDITLASALALPELIGLL